MVSYRLLFSSEHYADDDEITARGQGVYHPIDITLVSETENRFEHLVKQNFEKLPRTFRQREIEYHNNK